MKNHITKQTALFAGVIIVLAIAALGFSQFAPKALEQVSENPSSLVSTATTTADATATGTVAAPTIPDDVANPAPAAVSVDPTAIQAIVNQEVKAEPNRPITDSGQRAVITLAGGCFWCTEAYLQETPGVVSAVSGYAGGEASTATYKQVVKGTTGHREAVQVTYDPARITLQEVLAVYWSHINPTDAGGQFADRGSHYTTAIYFHNESQRTIASASKQALTDSGLFSAPIVTPIVPFTTFFEAEEYHQDYYKKSSEHYERYKKGSGRAGYVEENWAKAAALEFIESQ